ncbi:MAG TPA: succinate dehydrogenase, hydrophobic membrane anchor protein [Rhodospirillaceae bacterium]|nr:succinate dehydrogenase, hydrophobic membrane anchor protein [Rhodospirillaceae bacterium]HAA92785.1 succinate dehydrogenase, hydrophobic membrane anchor protein [Rhodospirillaceae bacterium]HAT35209.1 succinate dehydrogenase, hydrophobic membrane anchor protein [Rhodospirillaceae bacterium]|tara:strand:- start:10 stop:390 length:381 start_codon:yes stop_codon:yes gene_type:complete
MSLQNPLARARGLGTAKAGAEHWLIQRVSAVALIPLTVWFIYAALTLAGADYATTKAWLATPHNAILMVLLIIATFHHMQMGLQVIIEDYVHVEAVKVISLIVNKLVALGLGVASIFAVLKVAFGG